MKYHRDRVIVVFANIDKLDLCEDKWKKIILSRWIDSFI